MQPFEAACTYLIDRAWSLFDQIPDQGPADQSHVAVGAAKVVVEVVVVWSCLKVVVIVEIVKIAVAADFSRALRATGLAAATKAAGAELTAAAAVGSFKSIAKGVEVTVEIGTEVIYEKHHCA